MMREIHKSMKTAILRLISSAAPAQEKL